MDYCPDHGKVMQELGTIKGQNEILLQGQSDIYSEIKKLTVNGAVAKVENENTKAKFTPFYWVISVTGSGIILAVVAVIAKKLGWG